MTSDEVDAVLGAYLQGEIPPPIALMRLVLGGMPCGDLIALLKARSGRRAIDDLLTLAESRWSGLTRLEAIARAGADHGPGTSLEATRAMFDRLVEISPEAAVAAYSLGDGALLDAATDEVVEWLDMLRLLADQPRVLDLGCGIGRIAAALAPRAASVRGLDISPAMIAAARARNAGRPALRFETCSGQDLAGLADASFELVLAVDVFPYVVQAGAALAGTMLREAARVLTPGGHLVILNFSYGDAATDHAQLLALAPRSRLILVRGGVRPFCHWDGNAFLLRKQ